MPQNGINHPGITALAEAFAVNPLLRVINLNDNTFTEKGAVAMAEVSSFRLKLIPLDSNSDLGQEILRKCSGGNTFLRIKLVSCGLARSSRIVSGIMFSIPFRPSRNSGKWK